MEQYHKANELLLNEDYTEAVKLYTAVAESMSPSFVPAYVNRGLALLQTAKYEEAVKDFSKAIELDSTADLAYLKRGLALYQLSEYSKALESLEKGLSISKKPSQDLVAYERTKRKCLVELEANENAKPCNETQKVTVATEKISAAPSAAAAPVVPANLILPIRYQYYQSNKILNLSVMAKNMREEDVSVTIQTEHLRVAIRYIDSSGAEKVEVVIDKPLFGAVDTEKSTYKVLKPKIEIVLHKLDEENWPTLDYSGAPRFPRPQPVIKQSSTENSAPVAPSIQPKPYASKKDWDKVGSEIIKELEAEKPEGEEALNALFQQIYRDADVETRMAMKKSFQTSGGTVLSTNWKEVAEKNYEEERQAPKGMEWRNWEGKKLKQVDD